MPIEMAIRRAVMRSEVGAVGRVVETEPFSKFEWERTSRLVVDQVVFGAAAVGDTIHVSWRSNRRDNPEGGYTAVACGGGTQLIDLHGSTMFFLLAEVEAAATRLKLSPIDLRSESPDS
jgi:hypothetical protein